MITDNKEKKEEEEEEDDVMKAIKIIYFSSF